MPIPVYKQFTEEQCELVSLLFSQGKTHQEIGNQLSCPRRTIMKLCKHLGLSRSNSEVGKLNNKSFLDSPDIVDKIRTLRNTKSLQEIVLEVGGSISAVQRICNKYNIKPNPDIYKTLQSKKMRDAWTDDMKQQASINSRNISKETRKKLSENNKAIWKDNKYRIKQLISQKRYWNSEKGKHHLALARSNQSGRVSSIQSILYSILDDLNVNYYREYNDKISDKQCMIGPYNFDCVIPRLGKRTLLIECQGDYWHTQEKAIRTDKQKFTYYKKYLAQDYELKYLWEHEFGCHEKISELLKYWLDITKYELIDFDFKDLNIRRSQAKEYRLLLDKYHYLSQSGKGGRAWGAYLDGVLVAICVFSPLIRQNILIDGYAKDELIELSRLCIHPRYQKKNFASWFVSRCIKQLPSELKCIISYCDTTVGHDGAIYKALNFVQDKVVRPDYWYVKKDGWVMGKKRLYDKAIKMSLKESQYAEKFGYRRVYGKEKLRFVLER